jgi:hypothetical protein
MGSAAIVRNALRLAGLSVYGTNSSDGRDPDSLGRFVLRESPCLLALTFDPIGPRRARVGPHAVLPIAGLLSTNRFIEKGDHLGPRIAASRRGRLGNRGYQIVSLQSPSYQN